MNDLSGMWRILRYGWIEINTLPNNFLTILILFDTVNFESTKTI